MGHDQAEQDGEAGQGHGRDAATQDLEHGRVGHADIGVGVSDFDGVDTADRRDLGLDGKKPALTLRLSVRAYTADPFVLYGRYDELEKHKERHIRF